MPPPGPDGEVDSNIHEEFDEDGKPKGQTPTIMNEHLRIVVRPKSAPAYHEENGSL